MIFKVVNGSTEKSYYVNVNRASDDILPTKNLKIEVFNSKGEAYALTPAFSPATGAYALTIPHEETLVDVRTSILDSDVKETISVNGNAVENMVKYRVDNLQNGDNIITIALATPSGNKRYYSIVVNRADGDTILPVQLDDLKVLQSEFTLTPAFDINAYAYNIVVKPNTEFINLIPTSGSKKIGRAHV